MTATSASVSEDFVKAVLHLHHQEVLDGKIVFVNHNDGKGIFLDKWDINAPLPSGDEISAALEDANKSVIRDKRAKLLYASDWTQLADCQLTPEKKAEWAAYRQALRDAPETGVIPQEPSN